MVLPDEALRIVPRTLPDAAHNEATAGGKCGPITADGRHFWGAVPLQWGRVFGDAET